ncbi:Long-chain fatty acid transport protein OS=Sphingobium scionense OX=1404341 GN=GGQ90_003368 PE=3 SV=1 [Sphingobium scionense]|uniref:Long-chain fatty acid transport protein n=2 Tax=Sphingobium scionense TaxID=1404341 RepID=A0A7W6LUG5_9SPHN|nr:outer membrane protein transport protein [Sphingobium scionense]MBB4149576.1 long-chain fatty acid transport protein [Sphingobium scionense]
MKSKLVLASGFCMALFWSGSAHATDGFNFIGYGPTSIAMGGTGAAYDIGPAGMMINPATLALMPDGCDGQIGGDIITSNLKIRNTATGEVAHSNSEGTNNGPYYAPEVAFVCRKGRYTLGIGSFAAAGVGTQYAADSFLSRTVTNTTDTGLRNFSRMLTLRIPVSAAYQVTDRLAVGGSLDVVWTSMNVGLLLDTSQIGTLAAQQRLSGSLVPTLLGIPQLSGGYLNFTNHSIVGGAAEGWGIGGKLGATYQVSRRTRLGIVYSFKTSVSDLTGHSTLTAVSAVAGNIPLSGKVRVRDFQGPAQFTAGVFHEFSDRLSVAVDYQRMFWGSAMKNVSVGFKDDASGADINLSFPTNYRDTNVVGVGVQYRLTPRFAVRGGFHYADEPTPGHGVLAIIPSTPTTNITGGGSWALGKNSALDFALTYAFPKSVSNDGPPNTAAPIEATHSQIAASIAFRKHF